MNLLEKIQQWPERRKKLIVWLAVIILGVLLLKFYIADIQKKVKTLTEKKLEEEKLKEQFQFEKLEAELNKSTEGLLKEWEEVLKKFYENLQKNEEGKNPTQ